jgi:hypothetical protein
VVCTQASNPRSLAADAIAARVSALASPSTRVETEPSPIKALDRARQITGSGGLLAVAGSNYLLADLLRDPAASAGATL